MIELYEPKRDDLWYRQALMADPATMSYNDAWGGTIPFPEEDWDEWFDWWLVNHEGKRLYRYLLDSENGEFVGEVNYHFDEDEGIFLMGIVVHETMRGRGYGRDGLILLCQAARENGIAVLYNTFEPDDPALPLFERCGFVEDRRTEELIYLRRDL